MQRVAAALVVIQDACRTRPADPSSDQPDLELPTAMGFEATSKALLGKLDSMQAQVHFANLSALQHASQFWHPAVATLLWHPAL